jgi:lysozyme family protein
MEGKNKKGEEKNDDSKAGGTLVFDSNIGAPTYFPIQPTSLNFPTYDRSVQILQTAMLQAFGNVLPVHGADGKFGFETWAAIKAYINPQGIVTKNDWDGLLLRLKQLTTQAQQFTEEAKIIRIPAPNETTQPATTPTSGKFDTRIKPLQIYDLPRKDFLMEQGDPALMGTPDRTFILDMF